ncbi:MAG: cadmium-translocating P-type ATPase [Treponemataceae bacterium]|nr:cadmium-translocating P-type ATPase [Treponemataceae bacterium]
MTKKQKKNLVKIILSTVILGILLVLPIENPVLTMILYLVPYLIIGFEVLKKAFKGILKGQVFDENFLMAVATVGAYALGDFKESTAVMLFYQVGELFESIAVGKSRRNIADLMDIRPDYANIEKDGAIERVDPSEVAVGTVIIVQPGEKIPIDGIVSEGSATIDTSALTGESVPRSVAAGDNVMSGCINLSGVLKITTTTDFGESTVAKILDLVENASSKKSKSEEFITKFARYYTPAVCFSALALAVIPPVASLLLKIEPAWTVWLYRALTFLVISCPCALVISIPLSFFAGIGAASRSGVLIKGSNYLETLSKAKYLVFDKTGTLTKGVFEVTAIHSRGYAEEKLLEYAAHAEGFSNHPISLSLKKAWAKEIDRNRVSDVEEIAGHGVKAKVDGVNVACGNAKLMKVLGIEADNCDVIGTVIHIAVDGVYAGNIVISDRIKDNAKEAMAELKNLGVKETVMLTGDASNVAEKVAAELKITRFYGDLLPGDKVSKVEELIAAKKSGEVLAFVGDGINDAPVLTRSDIGIAMGALGSDAAIEAADMVLMDDNPYKIVTAIRMSKKCIRIVYENIWFAIGVKLICLLLGALGIANMWLAIFADVGVMMIAVLNAIRMLRVPKADRIQN